MFLPCPGISSGRGGEDFEGQKKKCYLKLQYKSLALPLPCLLTTQPDSCGEESGGKNSTDSWLQTTALDGYKIKSSRDVSSFDNLVAR